MALFRSGGRHVRTGGRRTPVLVTLLASVLAVPVVTQPVASVSASTIDPCREPALRDVMISQGLPSYAKLVRNRETLVKFLLSKKSKTACSSVDRESIRITSATLNVTHSGGGGSGVLLRPVAGSAAVVGDYTTSPVPDSGADPVFRVEGSTLLDAMRPTSYPVTLTGTVSYETRSSTGTLLQSGRVQVQTMPGTSNPITATIAERTRPLRLLFVPMYDAQNTINPISGGDEHFNEGDEDILINALPAVGRIMPVADGVGAIGSSAGVQYHLSEGVVNLGTHQEVDDDNQLRTVSYLTDGVFCGDANSFDYIKQELAEHRTLYNTENPLQRVDRVIGVISQRISVGPTTHDSSCAEGYGSLTSPESWVRLAGPAPDLASPRGPRQATVGGVIAQELQHNYGGSTTSGSFHSVAKTADATASQRAYNTLQREYVSPERNRSALAFSQAPWDDYTVLYEKRDWDFTVCVLASESSTASRDCGSTASGATGAGVLAAGGSMVMSGRTGKTKPTTDAHTYFEANAGQDGVDPDSDVRLIQRDENGAPISNQGVRLSAGQSVHPSPESGSADGRPVFDVALPATGSAKTIELRHGTEVLYQRTLNNQPKNDTIVRLPGSSDAVNFTNDGKSTQPALSPNGDLIAWTLTTKEATGTKPAETTVVVADARDISKKSTVDTGSLGGRSASAPAWHPDGGKLAFIVGEEGAGDVYTVTVTHKKDAVGEEKPVVLGAPREVYDAGFLGAAAIPLSASHPSYAPDGKAAVVAIAKDLWKLDLSDEDATGRTVRCSVDQNVGQVAGGCTRLTNSPRVTESSPAWGKPKRRSTDSTEAPVDVISYVSDGRSIWALLPGSSAGEEIAAGVNGETLGDPAWSDSVLVFSRPAGLAAVDGDAVADHLTDDTNEAADGTPPASPPHAAPFSTSAADKDPSLTRLTLLTTDTSETPPPRKTAFVRATKTGNDVFIAAVQSRGLLVVATDETPELLRLDVALACNGVNDPVVTGARPVSTDATTKQAVFHVMYQAGKTCSGADTIIRTTDGILVDRDVLPGDPSAGDPPPARSNIAIHAPLPGAVLLQYQPLAIAGSAIDARGRVRQDLSWRLRTPLGEVGFGTGAALPDVLPRDVFPKDQVDRGWPPGDYTLIASLCEVRHSSGACSKQVDAYRNFKFTDDRDGDLLVDTRDDETKPGLSCYAPPAGAVTNPSNALGDPDGDLLPSLFDPQPCESRMDATVKTTPTSLNTASSGSPVTAEVRTTAALFLAPKPEDVRIVQIAGLSTNLPAFQISDVTPASLVAKFDRQTINAFIIANGLQGYLPMVVEARTSTVRVQGYDASSPTV